ncbi:hypothetical protein KSF73_05910, partial [Burkholderiaceae bacterium DAT-1]|nr:hypothetical protein [Burkholderiaceae bacterium DAT-1]
ATCFWLRKTNSNKVHFSVSNLVHHQAPTLIGCILLKSGADFFASLHSFRLLRRIQREAELYVAFKSASTP